jgi:hypothetical protein
MTVFYDFSGGMESASMLVVDRQRIRDTGAIVRIADTGKQFPEMPASIQQIEAALDLQIVRVPPRITFEQFLFERGGLIRKGTVDCSKRMKRANLTRHMKTHPRPYEVNLGFNLDEDQRARDFVALNEREWCKWRFPLIEAGVDRDDSWEICRKAGFTILVGMYEKMGRFDCFWCGNQTPAQAYKVAQHYPELAKEWMAAEAKKGHSFLPVPLSVIVQPDPLFADLPEAKCGCFGGKDCVLEDDE